MRKQRWRRLPRKNKRPQQQQQQRQRQRCLRTEQLAPRNPRHTAGTTQVSIWWRGRLPFCRTFGTAASTSERSTTDTQAEAEEAVTRSGNGVPCVAVGGCQHPATNGEHCSRFSPPPPSPLTSRILLTKRWRATSTTGRRRWLNLSRSRGRCRFQQTANTASDTASWGFKLVDPTGSTVYPHRLMLPHVTLMAGRKARRWRRRSELDGSMSSSTTTAERAQRRRRCDNGGSSETIFDDGGSSALSSASSA
jgi:hypothetical protein